MVKKVVQYSALYTYNRHDRENCDNTSQAYYVMHCKKIRQQPWTKTIQNSQAYN